MRTKAVTIVLLTLFLASMVNAAFKATSAATNGTSVSSKSSSVTQASYPYEEFIIVGDKVGPTTLDLWLYYFDPLFGNFVDKRFIDTITGVVDGADIEMLDADNDADLDFIVVVGKATGSPTIYLYVNQDVPTNSWPTVDLTPSFVQWIIYNTMLSTGVAWGSDVGISSGDFDNDGDADFVVYSASSGRSTEIYVFINNGGLAFVQQPSIVAAWATHAYGIDVGDFDEDGNLDFVMFDYPIGADFQDDVAVYFGNGDGTFQPATIVFQTLHSVSDVTVQDFNNDGHFDIIIGKDDDGDPGQTWLYRGNGAGGFAAPVATFDLDTAHETGSSTDGCGRMDSCDAKKDGSMDVVACASGLGSVYYMEGLGTGQFSKLLIDNTLTAPFLVGVPPWGIGYFIIVEGSSYGGLQPFIQHGCEEVFKLLQKKGFTGCRIYYMGQNEHGLYDIDGDTFNDIDAFASSANLQWAVETWAKWKVRTTEPLFFYLFDHGGGEVFCIDDPDLVWSTNLDSWLTNLETSLAMPTPICVIYAACHSGSFIDAAGGSISNGHPATVNGGRWYGRVVVSSCRAAQSSWVLDSWERFSVYFWQYVQQGDFVTQAFNNAYVSMKQMGNQDPAFDDNGDAVENPTICSLLPTGTDGLVGLRVNIGKCSWIYPWISYVVAKQYFTWPPPPTVTLWAKVENETQLTHVRAWMKPPDWTPPPPDSTLQDPGFECYEMSDPDCDGNWTVSIPAVNFTNHATGPSDFKFFIDAEEAGGMMAISKATAVGFTSGIIPTDSTVPTVYVYRPLSGQSVGSTIVINGTATDDVCLKRMELYLEGSKIAAADLPPTSNSFYKLYFNTGTVSNGEKTITIKAIDTSGNSGNQTLTVRVFNPSTPVGGFFVPLDKPGLLVPYVGLASVAMITAVATAIRVNRVRQRRRKQ